MARRLLWILMGIVALGALTVAALTGGSGRETPGERSERLARGIRCPTCQGLSAAESDAKAATAVRAEIARRVAEGGSDEQIRQALVDRYGESILLTPRGEGIAAVVWALPVAALVVGGSALALHFRRGRESPAEARAGVGGAPRSAAAGLGRPAARGMVAVGAVALVAVAAGFAVARTAGERLPGDSATGTVDLGPAELLVQARSHLREGRAVEALKLYDQVLEQDPVHPEALAYRGWLIRLAGDTEEGMEFVESAITADPEYPDAHLFKGVILLDDLGQPGPAAAELRRFLELDPDSELATEARRSLARAEAAA